MTKRQQYGIYEDTGCSNNLYLRNDIINNKLADINVFPGYNSVPQGGRAKYGTYFGAGTTTGVGGIWQGNATAIAVGSGGSSGVVRTAGVGVAQKLTTGATINSLAGIRINATSFTQRDLNPDTWWYTQLQTSGDTRFFMGYTSGTAAPTSSADPLANLSGVGFWLDTGVNANWHIIQNSGGASSDITTIPNVAASDTSLHLFRLRADNTNTKFQYQYGGGALTDINTTIPAATTGLGWMWYMECLVGSAAKTYLVYFSHVTQDG